MIRTTVLLSAVLLASASHEDAAASALADRASEAARPLASGDALTVRLVTVAPGNGALSRFGHGAIWIHDASSGADDAYTFGRSDARRFTFLSLLIQGRADVRSERVDAVPMLDRYAAQGRAVRIQTLDLTAAQRGRLRDFLEGERGLFRYHLFLSNCTTRLRDAIDLALGGHLRAATASRASPRTYRAWVGDFMTGDATLYALSGLVLARRMDRPISVWEEMFLPSRLAERLTRIVVERESGEAPLVTVDDFWQGRAAGPLAVSRGGPSVAIALALGLALGSTLALLGRAARSSPRARVGFSVAGGAWTWVAGTAGLALAAIWAFTGEPLAAWNENLLQANPLALLAALAAWGSWRNRKLAARAALAVAAIAVAGLVLKAVPGSVQANGFVLAFALPAHAGLAWGMWSFAKA